MTTSSDGLHALSAKDIRWQQVTERQALEKLWPHWDELVQQCEVNPLFNNSAWLRNWLHHYWQSDWQLCVQLAWYQDILVAIIPTYRQPGTFPFYLSTAYPLGQGESEAAEVASEYLDVIVDPRWSQVLVPSLGLKLRQLADQLKWRALLDEARLLTLLGPQPVTAKSALRYSATTSAFSRQNLSKNTRAQHNRGLNKLAKAHSYQFRWAAPEEYPALFAKLTELHQVRWRQAGKRGAFDTDAFCAFHQDYLKVSDQVLFSVLEADQRIIAIHYYLRDHTTLYFYQSGWDSKHAQAYSPGLLLHCWSIEHCPCSHYDFMMGATRQSYKARLAPQQTKMKSLSLSLSKRANFLMSVKRCLRIFRRR